jgi:hypothetical protein
MADIARDDDQVINLDETPGTVKPPADVVNLDREDDGEGLPAHAVQQDDGSVLLPLLHPVSLKFSKGGQVREERIEQLVLHRLTGADMRALSNTGKDRVESMAIARSARMPAIKLDPIYDRMDGADVAAAGRVIAHFLGAGRTAGR